MSDYSLYIKALHLIFIVTWFSGIFYIVRLFIYTAEANEREEPAKTVLVDQFKIMSKRLWLGITWPSAILTLIFGPLTAWQGGWFANLRHQPWLHVKLTLVFLLYIYFASLHVIYKQQQQNIFKYTSNGLRIWNEVATVFLIAIVFLSAVKNTLSWIWAVFGLILISAALMAGIKIYKLTRER